MSDDTLRRGLVEAARKLQVLNAENEELRRRIAAVGGDAVVHRVDVSHTRHAGAPSQPSQPRLTRSQRWMWLLHQLAPDEPTYHVYFGARLRGQLDRAALRRAVDEVVGHHEALRMSVHGSGAEPIVVVHAESRLSIEERDFRAIPEAHRQRAFDEAATEFSRKPLPLDTAPCGRALLATLADGEHALMFVWQHLIMDGTSCGLLVREVLAKYEATVSGHPSAAPATRWTSSDYAAWEEADLNDARLATLREYWAARLREMASLDLPTDRAPVAGRDDRGNFLSFELPPLIGRAVKGLAVEHGCTIFAALASAVAVLLHRYSGQDDIGVAVVTANRRHAEARDLIGCFINTFVFRMSVADDPTASELLRRTRGDLAEAMAHQELPFDELPGLAGAGRIAPPRVSLAMESIDLSAPAGAGLQCEPVLASISADAPGTAKFDLSFAFAEVGGRHRGTIGYRVGLFDHETIERMARHLTMLIEAMAESPEVPVSRLRMLTPAETSQLEAWNDTRRPRDGERMLHRLVEQQAARTPDAIAVLHDGASVTYAELDSRANALAAHLRTLGVVHGARIAVYLERSPDLIVALLAVLKTGSAYVPIDIEYPEDRVRFMLEDSGCTIVLVSERSSALVPAVAGVSTVDVSSAAASAAADVAGPPSSASNSPNDLAYLIYTSGSTGTPKAVAIEHRSAAELIAWALESYSREDLTAVLASTSICFDLSVFEIFVPLCAGGTVVVVHNALALADGSNHGIIRLLNTVPSAAAELLRLGAIPNSVRVINLAGEPLRASVVDALYAGTQVRDIYDLYGPSEDTTYSTWTRREPGGPETIGRPVSNTRAYVLDRWDALVPINVPGQLHLAGAGLARGYFGREALTAERFVPNPFGAPGERMYRTGDLVRRRSDGRLEYLGRMDRQVKLRGYRIELGEIEAAFVGHAAVRECAAIVHHSGTSDATIVAFVTAEAGEAPAVAALRTHVASVLPAYMVPQRVLVIDALPRTRNGKLDHGALVALVTSADVVESFAARAAAETPVDGIERAIATIWADELHRDAIGRHDHFFDLGGHSLVATRVASRLESVFGRRVPVTALFQYPVLSALADHLRGAPVPTRVDAMDAVSERVHRQARGIRNFQSLRRPGERPNEPLVNEEQ